MTHLVWTADGAVNFHETRETLAAPDTGSVYTDAFWNLMRNLVSGGSGTVAQQNAALRNAMATESGLPVRVLSAPPRTSQLATPERKLLLRVVDGICYVDEVDVEAGAVLALPPLSASFSPFTWTAILRFMRARNPSLTTVAAQETAIFAALINNVSAIIAVQDRR